LFQIFCIAVFTCAPCAGDGQPVQLALFGEQLEISPPVVRREKYIELGDV